MKSAHRPKPTKISLPAELVEEARELGVNLSRELQAHLEQIVLRRRAENWRRENQKAFESYAKYFEQHGVWNEDERGW